MRVLRLQTERRTELRDITRLVDEALAAAGVGEGVCHLFVPHTTAGLTVNEGADPDVAADIVTQLGRLAPPDSGYRHVEGNADAHVKSVLAGPSLLLPVSGGRLRLGRWQAVFFCEFDGPRTREVWLTFLPAAR